MIFLGWTVSFSIGYIDHPRVIFPPYVHQRLVGWYAPRSSAMQRSATSRLAGLSVPPGSIAHLGLNSRSLSASLLNLKAEQQDSDTDHQVSSRRKELDEISIDSNGGDSLGDDQGSGDEDEQEKVGAAVPEPDVDGNNSPLIAIASYSVEDELPKPSFNLPQSDQDEGSGSSGSSDASTSAGTIPTPRSPPPTYEFATGPLLTPKAQPEAGPSRSRRSPLSRSTSSGRIRRTRSSSSGRRSAVADRERNNEDQAISSLEASLNSLVPALLERVPSSSSERSLFRSFDDEALRRRGLKSSYMNTATGISGKGDGEDDDPNAFVLSISDPPSPRSRSNSISMPGKADGGKMRGSKGKRRIKIVDRSGGEWRDLVEQPDEEGQAALDGDELSERIFRAQALAHGTVSEDGGASEPRTSGTPTLINKRLDLDRTRSSPRINSPSPETTERPALNRHQTSSNLTQAGEPFTRDVQIIGWKIVGGETKVQKDRPGSRSNTLSTSDARNYVEVERGKIGAFVGKSSRMLA